MRFHRMRGLSFGTSEYERVLLTILFVSLALAFGTGAAATVLSFG